MNRSDERPRGRERTESDPRRPRVVATIDPTALVLPDSARALLHPWADRAGEIEDKLKRYVAFLLNQNAEFNLTSDRYPALQWSRHVEDGLLGAKMIEDKLGRPPSGLRIADIGSGGGMPGLIWAILWPEAEVHLIESVEKKAEFLRRAAKHLNPEKIHVIQDRAEKSGQLAETREHFDWVTARAVGPLGELAEYAMPLLKIGGWAIAIKGEEGLDEELKDSRRAFRLLGGAEPPLRLPYVRPDGKACNLILVRKTERTPSTYPRRQGLAAKHPL